LILSYQSIVALNDWRPILFPFEKEKVIHDETGTSYGCGACGYDVRIAQRMMLSPGAFVLASTVERFDMPFDLAGFVTDKSSLARIGIAVQNTKVDPGWRGYLTLEISNHSSAPVLLVAGQPIAEITFQVLDKPTMRPYSGKYQDQPDHPVGARAEKSPSSEPSPSITAIAGSPPTSGF
jgi:dCTP deaminase